MSERHIQLAGGRAVFVSERDGAGALPVLFLNSLAADLSMWDGVRARMARPSIAFDTRGHGRSDLAQDGNDVGGLAKDALAVMEAAGLDRAILCGLSLGGLTAMELAARRPERVAGLVLANTAIDFPPPSMWAERAANARTGGFEALVQPTLERWLSAGFREANPDVARRVREMIASMSPEGYAAACEILEAAHLGSALGAFEGPVLAIAGAHDQSTPVGRAEEIVDLAQNGRLVVLDAAHLSAIERPAAFADALEDFARQVESDG